MRPVAGAVDLVAPEAKMINLKQIADQLGVKPQVVFEVGVYTPDSSHVKEFFTSAKRIELFEPSPESFQKLTDEFGKLENVKIHNVAIWKRKGRIRLFNRNASTFVEGEKSPAKINDGYTERPADILHVDADIFDSFDQGDIDLLAIDTEGCEWYAIEKMKSRPAIICVETHGMRYINPHLSNIQNWMAKNGYVALDKDVSDTVFVKNSLVNP